MENILIQYVYRRKKMVGAVTAVRVGDRVGISASLCNTKLDQFNKPRAVALATDRALLVLSGRICPVAHSLREDIYKMVARANRYFKGLEVVHSAVHSRGTLAI